jgi:hypothetical protein
MLHKETLDYLGPDGSSADLFFSHTIFIVSLSSPGSFGRITGAQYAARQMEIGLRVTF